MTKKEKLAAAEVAPAEAVEAPVEAKVEAPVEVAKAPKKVKVVKAGDVKSTPELKEANVKHEMIGTPTVGEVETMKVQSEVEAAPVVTTGEVARKRVPTVGKTIPVKDPLAGLKQNSANGDVIGAFTV